MTSVFLVLNAKGATRKVIKNPTIYQIQAASSAHVLGFTSQGSLLVAESEGDFSLEDWDEVYEAAKLSCYADYSSQAMQDGGGDEISGGLQTFVNAALQSKVSADLHWKD